MYESAALYSHPHSANVLLDLSRRSCTGIQRLPEKCFAFSLHRLLPRLLSVHGGCLDDCLGDFVSADFDCVSAG
jgi:hypothetical protein